MICNNQMIGDISIIDNNSNTYFISCFCVIPEYKNKRIDRETLRVIKFNYKVIFKF